MLRCLRLPLFARQDSAHRLAKARSYGPEHLLVTALSGHGLGDVWQRISMCVGEDGQCPVAELALKGMPDLHRVGQVVGQFVFSCHGAIVKKKTRVDKVADCVVVMRNGDRWKVSSFDEFEVKGWLFSDEVETDSTGINRGLRNIRKNKLVKADLL